MTHLSWFADPVGPDNSSCATRTPQVPVYGPGQRVGWLRARSPFGVTDRARSESCLPGTNLKKDVETAADGNAAYEADVVKADATPATVYVDKQFDVVSVESR